MTNLICASPREYELAVSVLERLPGCTFVDATPKAAAPNAAVEEWHNAEGKVLARTVSGTMYERPAATHYLHADVLLNL